MLAGMTACEQDVLVSGNPSGSAVTAVETAAAMEIETANAGTIQLDSYDGRWLVVNFWAQWCAPCRIEIPELNELNKREGIQVFGVDFDRHQDAELAQVIDKMAIEFPVLYDERLGDLTLPWPSVLPVTYLVRDGRIVETLQGPQTQEGLLEMMSEEPTEIAGN